MTPFPLQEAQYTFGANTVVGLVPPEADVQSWHALRHSENKSFSFPFWARIWPASVGLCTYLAQNTYLVKDKTVVELAAGLGLPSLLVANWARKVMCTDIAAEAVAIVQQAAAKNGLNNLEAFTLDWNDVPPLTADVLLLSDVNYNPDAFDALYRLLLAFIDAGKTIILSTPQRIMAKSFINRLMPYCTAHEVLSTTAKEKVDISVFVLRSLGNDA